MEEEEMLKLTREEYSELLAVYYAAKCIFDEDHSGFGLRAAKERLKENIDKVKL